MGIFRRGIIQSSRAVLNFVDDFEMIAGRAHHRCGGDVVSFIFQILCDYRQITRRVINNHDGDNS